jgi:hypothetical protein
VTKEDDGAGGGKQEWVEGWRSFSVVMFKIFQQSTKKRQ